MKKVTLQDVAMKAGVAKSTASYAINDNFVPGINIPKAKRDHIKKTAREMGYKVDDMARAISTGKAKVIGFACLNPADSDYFAPMIAHVMAAASRHGYLVKLLLIDASDADRLLSTCVDQRLSGVIFYALPEELLKNLVTGLRRSGIIPAVMGNALAPDDCIHVLNDDEEGSVMMVRELFDSGHAKIAFFGSEFLASDIRERGYRRAMAALNLDIPEEYVFRRKEVSEISHHVEKLIDSGNQPDAFFCSSDNIAATVITTLINKGLRVPEDASVAGFGNLSCGKFIVPNITTIDESHHKVASRVVDKIVSTLSKRDFGASRELISPTVISRQSIGERG